MNAKELENLLDRFFFKQKGVSIILSLYDGDDEVTFHCNGIGSYEVCCGPLCIQPEDIDVHYNEDNVTFDFAVEGGYAGCGRMELRYEDIDDKFIIMESKGTWILTPEDSE